MTGVGENQTVLRTVSVADPPNFGGLSPFEVNPLLNDAAASQTIRREPVSGLKHAGYTVSDANWTRSSPSDWRRGSHRIDVTDWI